MEKCKKIFFRADAGQHIGYGHFIRTLALADMLKSDFDCTFFTQLPTEYQKNEIAQVCKCVELPDENSKFELFINALSGNEIVVLDNYFFTTDYQKSIKAKGCKLICIDDLHDKHYVADIVINHGQNNPNLFNVEPYTELCLGLDWALLRKPFLEAARNAIHRKYSDTIEKIVICFGGSDMHHLTEKVIQSTIQIHGVQKIDVIIGGNFSAFSLFTDSRITFHQNISGQQIATLFFNCDLAIVSASTVSIEALACGAQTAAGWYVNNQKDIYDMITTSYKVIGLGNLIHDFPLIQNYINTHTISKHEHVYYDEFQHIPLRYRKLINAL